MYDDTTTTATNCDCADCRDYRLWRTEGSGEWQPKPDGWDAWSTSTSRTDTAADAVTAGDAVGDWGSQVSTTR